MSVVQLLEIPSASELHEIDADAIVVALKTRSVPSGQAIKQSLATLSAFRQFGISRHFFKYCSTFDSTREGNIGPVAVALLDALEAQQTIFCPAFPRNGRTVYLGHLFVEGMLLNESGMESHPLNPMTDANLVRVLGLQCDRKVGLLSFHDLELGASTGSVAASHLQQVSAQLAALHASGHSLVITDACTDEHLHVIASVAADLQLVTGGSGVARFLPAVYRDIGLLRSESFVTQTPRVNGRSLIISGSCSRATNEQVASIRDRIPCWQLDVDKAVRDRGAALAEIMNWAQTVDGETPLLLHSTASPEQVAVVQAQHGGKCAALAVEETLSDAAALLVTELGISRLIVAGGETSGAVVRKLGVRSLAIGAEICSGVPWTESTGDRPLALALKSGNFGGKDFFERALSMLP